MDIEIKDLSNWKELATGKAIFSWITDIDTNADPSEPIWKWTWVGGEDTLITQALVEGTPPIYKEEENIILFPPHRVQLLSYDPVREIYHGKHLDHK